MREEIKARTPSGDLTGTVSFDYADDDHDLLRALANAAELLPGNVAVGFRIQAPVRVLPEGERPTDWRLTIFFVREATLFTAESYDIGDLARSVDQIPVAETDIDMKVADVLELLDREFRHIELVVSTKRLQGKPMVKQG